MTKNPSRIVRISLTAKELQAACYLLESLNIEKMPDLFHFLLIDYSRINRETELRYGKDRKDRRLAKKLENEKIESLCRMSDEELTNWLVEIGYNPPDQVRAPGDPIIIQYRVKTNPITGEKELFKYNFDTQSSSITYSYQMFINLGELLKDLKKKKLI